MYLQESHIEFAEKSLEKADNIAGDYDDPFIAFVVLWIGFNALYGVLNKKYEPDKIKTYINNHKDLVIKFKNENINQFKELFQYVETTGQHSAIWGRIKTNKSLEKKDGNEANIPYDLAEVLIRVRRNMFHANKLWDEKEEAKLLRLVNPLLRDLLSRLVQEESYN